MKRFNLPLVSDSLFCGVCAFLLFYTAVRHYTKNIALSIIFGLAAAVLFGALAFIYIRKKQGRKLVSRHDEKQKNLLSLHLSVCPFAEVQDMFSALLDGKISGKNLTADGKIYFLKFCLSPLSPDDIAGVIKSKSQLKKVVLCNKISVDALALADNFLIEVTTLDSLYSLLKQKDLLPKEYIFNGVKKPRFFARIKSSFRKNRARPLFISGLCLLLFSYFTFFPAYYIVFGGLLLLLSLLCRLFGKA
jgi:hypothetical protein